MSDDNLTNHIPLKTGEEMMITQYDAPAVEANGLLKWTFSDCVILLFIQKNAGKSSTRLWPCHRYQSLI